MSAQQEAEINPDGSSTFGADANEAEFDATEGMGMGTEELLVDKIDPAWYLLGGAALVILITTFIIIRQRKARQETESFFTELDGEKVRYSFFLVYTIQWWSVFTCCCC